MGGSSPHERPSDPSIARCGLATADEASSRHIRLRHALRRDETDRPFGRCVRAARSRSGGWSLAFAQTPATFPDTHIPYGTRPTTLSILTTIMLSPTSESGDASSNDHTRSAEEGSDDETDECAYIGCSEDSGHDRYPKYCSVDCRYFDKSYGILQTIFYDHRFCSNCYRKIRNVYPPGRRLDSSEVYADDEDDDSASMTSIPEWAIGYADPTPDTVRGEREELRPRDPIAGDWKHEPSDRIGVRNVCKCGATHHQTVERPTKKSSLLEHATRLSDTVSELLNEGELSLHHDRETLLSHTRERKTDPDDHSPDQYILTEALGYAILDA